MNDSVKSVLDFKHVGKSFKQKNVLGDMTFSISENENKIIALLGANGAGKTTTINMILGRQIPDQGSITLFGMNPTIPEVRQCVGSTPQNVEFPDGIK